MALKCSGKCGMAFLIILNTLVLLLGLGLMIPGILVQTNADIVKTEIMPLLNQLTFNGMSVGNAANGLSITLIVLGVFIMLVAGLGAFGACCQNKCMLVTYSIIVLILWIAKIIIVILWFLMKDKVETEVKTQLISQLNNNYKADDLTTNEITTSWNYLFMTLTCCGVNAVTGTTNDFDNSVWQGTSPSAQIPKACCGATVSDYTTFSKTSCTDTVTSGEYHSTGCYDAIYNKISSYSAAFIGIGITILIIEILAVVSACLICNQVRKSEGKMV